MHAYIEKYKMSQKILQKKVLHILFIYVDYIVFHLIVVTYKLILQCYEMG